MLTRPKRSPRSTSSASTGRRSAHRQPYASLSNLCRALGFMATKLRRAQKKALNKAAWAQGLRWNGDGLNGDVPAYAPEVVGPALNGDSGGLHQHANGVIRADNSDLEPHATPAKRNNRWRG